MAPPPTEIELPYNFAPRDYQRPVLAAFDAGIRRFCEVWHRRSGKDKTFWNLMIREAATGRVGNYWYVFPTYTQGRKAIWDNIDAQGFRVRDHIPKALVVGKPNESEMSVDLTSGSTIQLIGSDNIDALVGTNPVGVVFSEYALQSPMVWQLVVQPILIENRGWAAFDFTPRGANHAQDLYEAALIDPEWHAQLLTVDDTGALDAAQIAQARKGSSDEVFRQEYMCDFEAGNEGSYYGRLLAAAKDEKRIARVPVEPGLPVHTSWDLGVGDATAIWFFQVIGRERRYVDYYETSGEGLPHYIKQLQARPYVYGRHYAPHDIEVREFSSGVSRIDTAKKLGVKFEVVKQHAVDDGIEGVRQALPLCWFDADRCRDGIAALRAYAKDWDEKRQTWLTRPRHDWASHGADSFRCGVMGFREHVKRAPVKPALPWYAQPSGVRRRA